MMNDKEFSELQLRMMIVPHQARGPPPNICTGNASTRSPTRRVSV